MYSVQYVRVQYSTYTVNCPKLMLSVFLNLQFLYTYMFYNRKDSNQDLQNSDLFSRSQNIHFVTENMHGFGFLGVKKFNKEFREH